MDTVKLIPTESLITASLSNPAEKTAGMTDEKKKQIAKNFESVFVEKLLSVMRSTIGDWGMEEDATSKQTKGIFWMYLGRDIADNGGLGMWKDIYNYMDQSENGSSRAGLLDQDI